MVVDPPDYAQDDEERSRSGLEMRIVKDEECAAEYQSERCTQIGDSNFDWRKIKGLIFESAICVHLLTDAQEHPASNATAANSLETL